MTKSLNELPKAHIDRCRNLRGCEVIDVKSGRRDVIGEHWGLSYHCYNDLCGVWTTHYRFQWPENELTRQWT